METRFWPICLWKFVTVRFPLFNQYSWMYQTCFVYDYCFFFVLFAEKNVPKSILQLNFMQRFHSKHRSEVPANNSVFVTCLKEQTVKI